MLRNLVRRSAFALVAASMLTAGLTPASALTLAGPLVDRSGASPQIDKVWWRGGWGWGWRGRGWGWGPAAVAGGVAAGVIVGSAIAARPAYGLYGPCWRQVAAPYGGWQWQRVC
jgi:hypothetical protein